MQIRLAVAKRRAVDCVHCHLPITRDDIVVEFDTAILHVGCWRVGELALHREPPPALRFVVVPEASPRLDKTAVTAKVLQDYGPRCADCISADCGLPVSDVAPAVKQLEATFAVKQDMGFCPECRRR